MRFKSALTKSLRAEKARFCPRRLRTANSRSADPAQGASRSISDLLTAGSKEDEIARTARSREQAVRSIERVKSRTSPVSGEMSKNPGRWDRGEPPKAASRSL